MWSFKKATVVWGVILGFFSGFFCFNFTLAAPSISFAADDIVIPVNSTTTLNWTVTDATSCIASGEWGGAKALSGSEATGNLSEGVKIFTLTCKDAADETTSVDVAITVADPPSLNFSAASESIDYNTATNLIWSSEGATSCEKYGDWSGSADLAGNEATENLISEKTFGIRCSGAGGTVEKAITISIVNPALQVNLVFFADDNFIDWNQQTELHWIATNADFCTASGGWGGAKDNISGDFETPQLVTDTTYTLYCANGSGSSVTRNVTIFVAPKVLVPVVTTVSADDTNIEYNTPATIEWTSENATYCRVHDGTWTGNLPTAGTYTSAKLLLDRTFTVRCYGDINDDDSIVINVGPNPAPPPTLNFSADSNAVSYNTGTDLNWTTTETTSLTAFGAWSGSKGIPAGSEATGNLAGDTTYGLEAVGAGGSTTQNVDIVVGDPTTPPVVNLTADDLTVAYNAATVVRWNAEDADWCKLRYDSVEQNIGQTGNRFTGNLIADKSYEVECGNAAGSTSKTLTVMVILLGMPPTVNLTADATTVAYGTGTVLRWVTANATECALSGVGDVAINGDYNTGALYLPRTYTLNCAGPGGVGSDSVTINISGTPDQPPTINFWADDYSFFGNGSTTLHWSMTDADRCWASAGPWNGDKAVPTGDEATVNLIVTTLYEISCENINGVTSDSLTITVNEANAVELDFYADNTEIEKNSDVTLTWNGKNANWCQSKSLANVAGWGLTNVAADQEKSKIVGPFTEYQTLVMLRCWNFTSDSGWKSILITAGDPPPSITMSAPVMVAYNSPATISWFADYAESCITWSNPAEPTWNGPRPTTGLQQTSNLKANTRFYLRCQNSEGETRETNRLVKVGASNLIAPQITFTSDRYIAAEGEEYTVSWNVSGANWCRAESVPNTLWFGNKNRLSGSENLIFSGDRQKLVLICSNAAGAMSSVITVNKGGVDLGLPNISFWADQTAVAVGGKTMLRWTTENADSCEAISDPATIWTGVKAAGGGQAQTQALLTDTEFKLTCTNVAGSRTASINVIVGGAPPGVSINFNASRYDVAAGSNTTLSWTAENAAYCYAVDPNGDFVGGKTTTGSQVLTPSISTTYKLVCGNDGGEVTATVPITVAKVITCPNPARIIDLGNTLQLTAWFKQDADAAFSCADTSGATDVTNGHAGFPTSWSSANGGVVLVNASGLATGIDYTETHGGPISVTAEYKEAKGETEVAVSPPPVTCWKCTESKTCQSEISFPVTGNCPADTYDSMHECAKSCRKPANWREVGP